MANCQFDSQLELSGQRLKIHMLGRDGEIPSALIPIPKNNATKYSDTLILAIS